VLATPAGPEPRMGLGWHPPEVPFNCMGGEAKAFDSGWGGSPSGPEPRVRLGWDLREAHFNRVGGRPLRDAIETGAYTSLW